MFTTKTSTHRPAPTPFARAILLLRQVFGFLESVPMPLLQLLFRVAVGVVFFRSGLVKIASWDSTVALFSYEYNVPLLPPELAATLAATVELTAPALLLIGFGSRFAAAAMLGMTVVIQTFVYSQNWPDRLVWTALLLPIVTRGAGALSLDHLLARRFFSRT